MAKKDKKTSLDSEVSEKTTERKLTPEQELFCLEYLKDFNATKAAERAGYSKDSARQIGSENLSKPYIQARIRDRMNEVMGDAKDDIRRIIDELKLIAFGDIKDVVSWDEGRELVDKTTGQAHRTFRTTIRDSSEMGDKSRMISEISESETELSSNRKVKLYDKIRAIELLGKYYKMFTDKVEHTNPDGNLKPQVFVYLPKNGRESE